MAGHGLADVRPTPLLATRLAVRRRARLAASVLLAAFIIAVALTYTGGMVDGSGHRRWLLLVLTALVVGLVAHAASVWSRQPIPWVISCWPHSVRGSCWMADPNQWLSTASPSGLPH